MDFEQITQAELIEKLKAEGSQFFSIVFFRRTDRRDDTQLAGDLRLLTSVRRNVTAHLKGGPTSYNADDKRLLRVFKMKDPTAHGSAGYRSIPFEGILAARLNGVLYLTTEGWARIFSTLGVSARQWLQRSQQALAYMTQIIGDAATEEVA